MTTKEPAAKLTADLLARKGTAAPAGFSAVAIAGRPPMPRATTLLRRAGLDAASGPVPAGGGPDDTGSDGGTDSGDRARVTLRLDEARHLRLKLAAAHLQKSLQEILTVALDRYLEQVAPEILRNNCVCLATREGRSEG